MYSLLYIGKSSKAKCGSIGLYGVKNALKWEKIMNRAQKMAWFLVIVIATSLVMSAVAVTILYFILGMPGALGGLACFGFSGFGGLAPIIFKKDEGKVAFDERDIVINRRAALAGFGSSYLFIGLACMVPFFILGPNKSISINCLPLIFGGAGLTCFFAHSVAILIQYGRGRKGKDNE